MTGDDLEACEAVIGRGLGSFCETGRKLAAIRDADPDGWDFYCVVHIGQPALFVDRLIELAVSL